MKVVIFCGGYGVRMGEETRRIPKPMIDIGGKPILWHIMRYYSMWDHDEFILCLGYKGEVVQQFFLSYNGALLNDFVLDRDASGTRLELLSAISISGGSRSSTPASTRRSRSGSRPSNHTWETTRPSSRHTGTGLPMRLGARDRVVPRKPEDRDVSLGAAAVQCAHRVYRSRRPSGRCGGHESLRCPNQRWFFVFKREIMDVIEPGDELVEETFERLIAMGELVAYPYEGFFGPMDTIKDRQRLESLHESGQAPWRKLAPDGGEDGAG